MKTRDHNPEAWRLPPTPAGHTLVVSEPGRVLERGHDDRVAVCFRSFGYAVTDTGQHTFWLHRKSGLGVQSQRIHWTTIPGLLAMDSDIRFFALHALADAYWEGIAEGAAKERREWKQAAADGRIKTRKRRGQNLVDVSIRPVSP